MFGEGLRFQLGQAGLNVDRRISHPTAPARWRCRSRPPPLWRFACGSSQTAGLRALWWVPTAVTAGRTF